MIWPLFCDYEGKRLTENAVISPTGKVEIYIVDSNLRLYHQRRITFGTKGYFMEGSKKTAELIVTEINLFLVTPQITYLISDKVHYI
jgi:hypothetical protein